MLSAKRVGLGPARAKPQLRLSGLKRKAPVGGKSALLSVKKPTLRKGPGNGGIVGYKAPPPKLEEPRKYFTVLYTKRSRKKHKSYMDGVVLLQGRKCELRSIEDRVSAPLIALQWCVGVTHVFDGAVQVVVKRVLSFHPRVLEAGYVGIAFFLRISFDANVHHWARAGVSLT